MTLVLTSILHGLKLEALWPSFESQDISDQLLVDLTDQDLRDLGVLKIGDRKRLLRAFAGVPLNDGAEIQAVKYRAEQGEVILSVREPEMAGLQSDRVPLPEGESMGFCYCPAGQFLMGGTSEVTISRGFRLGQTPVTQGQYMAVMQADPSHFKGVDRPVECVTWNVSLGMCHLE